ncbi:hypothetical protein SAMN06295912_10232 [Sphingomonas laterariae]|uniref:DUF7064 domain-containing protein n=1 Tax=Edaphosphingomonas laterariae TaxID=861865 RepID=A0A239C8M3_9SPHN|nr:hypothetical protein [Sphingomonas laterariae]SNS15723.1 hypothetical protein SAMN06295912_10232 [Sphingomonas laterariae]
MLRAEDRMHEPGADESWFESWWFAFYVPERRTTVYVYPWFRPNLGLCGGGVFAWDDRGSLPWTMLHHDYGWSRRYDGEAAMLDGARLTTPQGVMIDVIESGHRYRIRYDTPALAFDVEFAATADVVATSATTADPGVFKGHIDQPGRYRGWVRVGDERLDVDCHCVRDRSWGPRRDDMTDMHIGYFHATASARDAFLIVTHGGADTERFTMLSGYLIRDGIHAPLVEGTARMVRGDDLSPAACIVEARDAQGREFVATGHSITRMAVQVQPGMFNWSSFAEWQWDDVKGHGELQDTWHPDGYRAFARQRGAKA